METQEYTETATPAETLRLAYSPMRVSFTWWGTRKALSDDQKSEFAQGFDADSNFLSAGKKLIDTKHPAYKPLAKIKRAIVAYWKMKTLPFPEPGVRLLPRDKLEEFEAFMAKARDDLQEAAAGLQQDYSELRAKANHDLGRLFDENDYPEDISDAFQVSWNVENVSPPDWLLELKPEFYEREMQRIRGLFNNAVELAEVKAAMEKDLVLAPRRRITRRPAARG